MVQNIKSVLIGMTEEGLDEPSSALGYGISLARQANAHATIQASSLKVVMGSAFVSGVARGLLNDHNRRLRQLAEEWAERARGDAEAAGVTCSTETPHLAYSDLINAFVTQARVHDLSVLDAETATINADRGLIEALVFNSGRPVIVVPPEVDTFRCEHIIIAWDAGARAARAVNDALPLLKAARTVEIISVGNEQDLESQIPGAELAPHLARHGVNVSVKNLVVREGGIAGTLQEQAMMTNTDLIVMGAFNRSILREWILGGVTQSFLRESKVPLFMSY
ncbi:universal stress protein [Xanthobacter sp. TB0136]|uniref:universal stress protein n=1 Tax=Xanthobacter sp. TB0136 TaxID=3459177 RepID=UPI004039CAD2